MSDRYRGVKHVTMFMYRYHPDKESDKLVATD